MNKRATVGMRAKIAEVRLMARLVDAVTQGVNASALQGTLNAFDHELQILGMRPSDLEKRR